LSNKASDFDLLADECSIGSDPENDIQIDEANIEDFHCIIKATNTQPETIFIQTYDGASMWINGKKTPQCYLKNGDTIVLREQYGNTKQIGFVFAVPKGVISSLKRNNENNKNLLDSLAKQKKIVENDNQHLTNQNKILKEEAEELKQSVTELSATAGRLALNGMNDVICLYEEKKTLANFKKSVMEAAKGGLMGGAAGAVFGPAGVVVGGVLGLIGGWLFGGNKDPSPKEIKAELEEQAFRLLDCSRGENFNAISKSYKAKILMCHPDKNRHLPGAEQDKLKEKFCALTAAHKIISDYYGQP